MKSKKIALILIPLNLILVYFVYNSIQSEVNFNKDAKEHIAENVQKLKDLRALQIAYKKTHASYAKTFESLLYFFEHDSIAIVRAEGETPDSLTDLQAIELGIISRDTSFVPAIENVFDDIYLKSRNEKYPLDLNNLTTIPHTNKQYTVDAGIIEKGKVIVQVFEIGATYRDIFSGLDAENKKYDLNKMLKVGSMNEASLNGNWGE